MPRQLRETDSGRGASAWVTPVLLLGVLTWLAYHPSLGGGFLIDDDVLLTGSSLIKAPDGLWKFWFSTDAIDYWPLSNSSLWVEWRLWGENPMGYRVTNLVVHIVEAVLLWRILLRLHVPGAFLGALLFALHPVNVESVAWIAQRKMLLAMLFVQLSVLFYFRPGEEFLGVGERPATDRWYVLSLAAFALALLGKVSVAIVPVLLLWIVAWLRPLDRRDIARAVPFFVVAGVLVLVNLWFRSRDPHIRPQPELFESLLGAGRAGWFYLGKALWPVDLAFMYPVPTLDPGQWSAWLPVGVALATTAILWHYRGSRVRPVLYAWGYYWLALLPALGFTERLVVEDHYQHLATAGVTSLVAAALVVWGRGRGPGRNGFVGVVAVVLVGTLAVLSWRRAAVFTGNIALMRAAVEVYPGSALSRRNLGFALLGEGSAAEARAELEEALRIEPELIDARKAIATVLAQFGEVELAIAHLESVIIEQPDDVEALGNLGAFLREAKEPARAIPYLERALTVAPNDPRTRCNLGKALLEVGEVGDAIEQFETASRLDPKRAEASRLLAVAKEDAESFDRGSR